MLISPTKRSPLRVSSPVVRHLLTPPAYFKARESVQEYVERALIALPPETWYEAGAVASAGYHQVRKARVFKEKSVVPAFSLQAVGGRTEYSLPLDTIDRLREEM